MKSFPLKISSPNGDLFCGEVLQLNVRSTEGDLAILAGHIPFVCALKPYDCRITLPDESERVGHTDGGLLTVSADGVILLSGSFAWNE